ncbi:MAG: hypothetical protein HOK21_07225 [Rhodospirillaceae bacterium]|jgi:hypothetical protein|nr:hypothetical protein [Rhodospirillaceae bacterium]MBT4687397.1 hypothetical protein [Rhodospirillaceae bacterium]MBT5079703.1 hypothetical protein [Rhodospirillaceae bacterium]MBT5523858.1 hypothetical protein [Rhodospirillaceae bacterium]MBT5882097.1 hypothetical protein [Rhodospirillaceae bacterium]
MAYLQTTTLDAADRISTKRVDGRMPYYIAVPIWVSLAIVAWSPIFMLYKAFA